jgi:hypothetical protein
VDNFVKSLWLCSRTPRSFDPIHLIDAMFASDSVTLIYTAARCQLWRKCAKPTR